jgi:hypothetical protein
MLAAATSRSRKFREGGCPCSFSRQLTMAFLNSLHTVSPHSSVYVHAALGGVGPGGSLSALLMPRFFGGTPVGVSWQAATATAAYSWGLTIAALVFGWGMARGNNGGAVSVFDSWRLTLNYVICIRIHYSLSLFPFVFGLSISKIFGLLWPRFLQSFGLSFSHDSSCSRLFSELSL